MINVSLQDAKDVATMLGALMGGAGTLYAAIRGVPLLAAFADKVRIVRQRDRALERAVQAEEAAQAFKLAAEGWKASLDQNTAELSELRSEVAASRAEATAAHDEARRAKELLAQAIVYIISLHTFMRGSGNLPEMPGDLRAEIDSILENLPTGSHGGTR